MSTGPERWWSSRDSRTNRVEADAFAGVHHRKLPSHRKNRALSTKIRVQSTDVRCFLNQPSRRYLRVSKGQRNIGKNRTLAHLHANWGVAAPMIATKLAVLMMLPPWVRPFCGSALFSLMARMAYLDPHQTPLTLICMVRSQIFSSVFKAWSSAGCMIPALLN